MALYFCYDGSVSQTVSFNRDRVYGAKILMADQAEKVVRFVEKMFVKYGAVPADASLNEHLHKMGLRSCYVRNGLYYRAEYFDFNEGPAVVITATDNPSYASVGIQDNIGGFSADLPEKELEKEVRTLFDMESAADHEPGH